MLAMAIGAALAGCGGEDAPVAPEAAAPVAIPVPGVDPAIVAGLNRGVGLIGKFDFTEAETALAPLAAADPIARLALAIAIMNQTEDGAQERAIVLLDELLAVPAAAALSPRANYCKGLSLLYFGEPARALEAFRAADIPGEPDAYRSFYVGQCLEFAGDLAGAVAAYREAAAIDPLLRSSFLGLQRTLGRLGDEAGSEAALAEFQALADDPRARLAEFKYTRMGTLGEAILPAGGVAAVVESGAAALRPASTQVGGLPAIAAGATPSITVTDADADGRMDLFIAGTGDANSPNLLLLGIEPGASGDPGFRAMPDHPLAKVAGVRFALWGDVDNDGLVDVFLAGEAGQDRLFRQTSAGRFADITEAAKIPQGTGDASDGAIADLDHDGDLDLFLASIAGPNRLLMNLGDGSFRDEAPRLGLADGCGTRRVALGDLDGDRDIDLALANSNGANTVLRNGRLWNWTVDDGAGAFADADLRELVAADTDADGRAELFAVDGAGAIRKFARARDGSWKDEALRGGRAARGLAIVDLDGDGVAEALSAEGFGIAANRLDGGGAFGLAFDAPPQAWTPATLDAGGPSIAAIVDGQLRLLVGSDARSAYATVAFSGRTDPSQAMRSNASGVGTRATARIGERWAADAGVRIASGPGQSLMPVAIPLAGAERVDFLSLLWSDGVFQTELGVEPGSVRRIEETQRQLSSCPVIFVSNGDGFAFVTDCLGVGGVGYLAGIAPDGSPQYAPPRPWERVLFPKDLVIFPRDGALEIRLGEPMEEACYLDAARLVAHDLPPGWSMTVDERLAIGGPAPTGEPRFWRERRLPDAARDGRGRNVLSAVLRADFTPVDPGPVDRRFLGRLEKPHEVTLDFREPLDSLPGTPTLVAHGWVEYPYSQTMFAASQCDAKFDPPDLEAFAGGRWHRVLVDWGYPAGMPREMSLPLEGLPKGTTRLRMASNLEIYWDSLAVVGVEPCPEARRVEFPLVAASVAECGYPRRLDRPWKRPDYDYARRDPLWDCRHQAGFYTEFGPCLDLVAATDDAVAIFGPGEEVRLRFDPAVAETPAGWTRRLVLETDGWCKDMDLFTGNGETVGPLPARGEAPDPASGPLHARFNTRFRSGS